MREIRTDGDRFTDLKGRTRIFNGFNFVYKGTDADPDGVIRYRTPLNGDVLKTLVSRGVNLIRLGVTWAGIEPEMGVYNEAYLAGVKETVRLCETYGVFVYIDFHQDLFSAWCYCGDGAPRWACKRAKDGRRAKLIWAEGYFLSRSVQTSFDAFWANEPIAGRGLRDRYCDAITHTADYLKDCNNIIAWDVLNEPYPGTPGRRIFFNLAANGALTLLLSRRVDRAAMIRAAAQGRVMDVLSVADDPVVYRSVIRHAEKTLRRFDTDCYQPFLQAAAEAVRKSDPDGIILAENSYYSNTGIPCAVKPIRTPDGARDTQFAFAPHGYDVTVDSPLTNEASTRRVDFIFDEHRRLQRRLNAPVIVGEWGGMVPGGERYPALEHLIAKFDANGWSQTYWHWFPEIETTPIMDILSRPYPVAVAGRIKRYGYDRTRKTFDLTYEGDPAVKAPTLVYLPAAPKKIYSTKKYRLDEKNGAYLLQVYAGKGPCAVKVELS